MCTINCTIIHCMHVPMQCYQNAPTYFATVVSYMCKMFMKSTPSVNVIKTFCIHNLQSFEISQNVCPRQDFLPSLTNTQLSMKIRELQTKKIYNIDPWCQYFKTLCIHNLQSFVISQSVCPWQAFPAQSNKHIDQYENS